MFYFIIFCFGIPGYAITIVFIRFLFTGQLPSKSSALLGFSELWCMVILPLLYLWVASEYDCCHDETETALFSPEHSLNIYLLVIFCLIAYFYSNHRTKIATPVIEIIVNCLLLAGLALNTFISIQIQSFWLALEGNIPIIILLILTLIKNQQLFLKYSSNMNINMYSKHQNLAWNILHLKPLLKFPLLLVICLPLLVILSAILMLFGQKPDAFIRAFTEAYNRGFSQGDFKCQGMNQPCKGHYLCTVASKGHRQVVKPTRLGIRNGQDIICNRQLLISNAFEDVLQERVPFIHKFIRTQYNKVGHFIHCYYNVFNIKIISDIVYFLMKPLEWFFLLTLYTVDKKPENRIEKQYLSKYDRHSIDTIERRTTNACCHSG